MIPLGLCGLVFVGAYVFGRRNLAQGFLAVIAVGYVYGISRANISGAASHFIFDSAVVGFYLSQSWGPRSHQEESGERGQHAWLALLIGWPILLALLPFQTPLVTLVGFRGNVFFLPVLLLVGRLDQKGWDTLTTGLAALNLIALGFAGAEYFMGLERFYPPGPLTEIIYNSKDVGGFMAYRIPATFANAHSYAGTMVATLPFLAGAWLTGRAGKSRFSLLWLVGIAAALFGVLLAAARVHFVVAAILSLVVTFSSRVKPPYRLGWIAVLAALAFTASENDRMQRFKTLGDSEMLAGRIAGSVNRSFIEVMFEMPMGNGLGGGGTSVPYFLAHQVRRPILIENEYARILLEQGIVGLAVWLGFIAWTLLRKPIGLGRSLAWWTLLCYFALGVLGTGLLTSIPQSILLLMNLGWLTSGRPAAEAAECGSIKTMSVQPTLVR